MSLNLNRLAFQQLYATGRVINLGCSGNAARLKADLHVDYRPGPFVDGPAPEPFLLGDVRHVPRPDDSFDTAVLGEVLEHFEDETDAMEALVEARRLAQYLVLTVPRDDDLLDPEKWQYSISMPATHRLWIEAGTLWRWLAATGWEVLIWYQIDYGNWPCGWCVWAVRADKEKETALRARAHLEGRIA